MKINSIEQVNFKSIYIQANGFNERECMLADDIAKKLLGNLKIDDEKCRTWNQWLKEEKGIDVLVKRNRYTQDKLTVFGVKKVKNFDDASKMKDFFVVGNYHTTDFKPEDVLKAYREDKMTFGCALGTIALLGLCCIGAFWLHRTNVKNHRLNKEIPQKVIQIKDGIVDSLNIARFNENIKK